MTKENDKVIVLAGMIGAGKSTYTELIAKHRGSEAFYESVDDNRLLDLFYADRARYAFPLQVYFLNTRFKSIKTAMRNRDNVLDRSIYEDALFARINYEDGMMSEAEYDCYTTLLENMLEEVRQMDGCTCETGPKKRPDLLVYVRCSFDTILSRIQKRGRDYEQGAEHVAYFKRLHSRYDDWVFNHYKESEVLVINGDELDVTNGEDAKEVLRLVDERLAQLER